MKPSKKILLIITIFFISFVAEALEPVSINEEGEFGVFNSLQSSTSSDGRYVVFESLATNLVSDDTNSASDIFVYDRDTDTIERVSVDDLGNEANDGSSGSSISSDGRYVAFNSAATNLVAGDTNGVTDIFVYDRDTDTIERVSVDDLGNEGNDESGSNSIPRISGNGRYVAFETYATNLVAGDTNGVNDVFVYDRDTDTIERVSVDDLGNETDDESYEPKISYDGRYVMFNSYATNLVAGDTNGESDTFLYDRDTDTIEQISVDSEGNGGNDYGGPGSISADGKYIVYESLSSNLIADDTNNRQDVFIQNRETGEVLRISMSDQDEEGNNDSYQAFISADGSIITFTSYATNFFPSTPSFTQVYALANPFEETTTTLSTSSGSQGSKVRFTCNDPNATNYNPFGRHQQELCQYSLVSCLENSFTETLTLGSMQGEVSMLQTSLGISSDGIFGPFTKTAVISFQRIHSLVPDGIVGPLTRAVLNQSC